MTKKKLLIGVFAHPDDESFACAGTFLKEIEEGADAELILLTDGSAGVNIDNIDNIGAARLKEWRTAYELMRVRKGHFLGYSDGKLNNDDLQTINKQVTGIIEDAAKNYDDVEVITYDFGGLSGHIDHIVASRAAAYAFYNLKSGGLPMSRLRLRCLPREYAPEPSTAWLFAEEGRSPNEIDEVVDARQYHEQIVQIVKTHHTQRQDALKHIERLGDDIGLNYYITRS